MTVTAVVLAQFKATVEPEVVNALCARLLGLGEACVHPTTQKPYLLSIRGGKDVSTEGLQHGVTHGFVMEFATPEDRAYYLHEDPAHLAYAKDVQPNLEQLIVFDFTAGEY